MLSVSGLVAVAVAGWIAYTGYCLALNFLSARQIGIPIIVLPVDCGNPLWMSVDKKVIDVVKRLPFVPSSLVRFNWRGWEIADRYHAHQSLGDAFIFVTPGKN